MTAWERVADGREAARLVAETAARPAVLRALGWLERQPERCEREAAAIAETPSPTFDEGARAIQVERRLRAAGLDDVQRFGRNNVIARLGSGGGRGIAFLAHLDTVFAASTDHTVRRQDGRLYGPGIGDNACGIAGMIVTAAALKAGGFDPALPLWFVGDAAEEGLGDLRGARETMEYLGGRLAAVVAVEGTMLGRLGHIAVGSRRLRATFSAAGGHSWHDFGRPSAVHAAVRAAAEITALTLPSEPRTTFNIGRIEGGEGVNVLAPAAEFIVDLRSLSAAVLDLLYTRVEEIIRRCAQADGVSVATEEVGNRPAASLPRNHPLTEVCAAAIERTGLRAESTAGSTDANVPLSQGIPALALGITRGAGTHSAGEWVEIRPMLQGVKQLILVAAALAGTR